jgi:hypothetical protein
VSWREQFLTTCGPGLFAGITLGDWLTLLRENRFKVSTRHALRALSITCQAVPNSILRFFELARFGSEIAKTEVPPPLFIVGHYRSGTTLLHELLAVDRRFAYPNIYQTNYPHTFLLTEAVGSRLLEFFLPRRRPMDTMTWTMDSAAEDEFALCVLTRISPLLGWVYPNRHEYYDRHLTLDELSEEERERWRQALLLFVRKLTLKYRRPLVLKSPPHTARIRLLLELFPGAKFVHIHRDPFTVFLSSRHTFLSNAPFCALERPILDDLDEWILRQYRTMYDAYFAQREAIPPDHFHELAFHQLEADPVGEVERLYTSLAISNFHEVRPRLEAYVRSLAGYRKNAHPALTEHLRARIAEAWEPCFRAWGYRTESRAMAPA